jgi:hypothetical protein
MKSLGNSVMPPLSIGAIGAGLIPDPFASRAEASLQLIGSEPDNSSDDCVLWPYGDSA